ncbi:MAG: tRNA glutamyl-Q(34) synthetase GluQRS [Rhodobacteraceae bacterium]|uniref:tRNA glutamyl-Q(34) synthetase GluQRS n=1 Tax=Albidovulum sp. TaxID=1872424 RepID=UPI001D591458|nr:tRNA glutamyl-Q(34) synthetase GluQRS [Paracoccaceae bacterium]MCC0046416.1 tRNA glutamyl-Q(34) synthetase GluQRS [Defluviimonas sp.]HPE24494.1 tRNA glutamyl-Q(34) synthetase GluQRS [Albidovulum sp.]MCB2133182.1 tRNA glutamyl-Q(34) synthetase GluQRS [Paracoccaceae bacterium]MCB2151860.1 tRNA glutamyl-Q(34) synthetase GluQRS [Paracoccaceae bacterium]
MRTRFAPSPTGPLHLGHAYSAILAHDMARAAGGAFLLRMENTDLERCTGEWEDLILEDLTWLGLSWEEDVLRQSGRIADYNARLETLAARGLIYPCSCTRGDIRAALAAPQEGVPHNVYPGTCRGRPMTDRQAGDALRLDLGKALDLLSDRPLTFVETGQGHAGRHRVDAEIARQMIGDVVLSRKGEDIVAYFLASAFDDADQAITHVIRGEDLFEFTPIQVILQHLFNLPTPVYHHHRLIRDGDGKRLAKRDDARAIRKFRAEGATPDDIRRMVDLG